MKRWRLWLLIAFAASLDLVCVLAMPALTPGQPVVIHETAVPLLQSLDPARVAEGAGLYTPPCAACHGSQLEGTANWKQRLPDGSFPPPHDNSGHTWHHSDAVLLNIVSLGGDPAFNSKMPGFRDKLSAAEMLAILEFFRSRWGTEEREFQWWMTATGSDNP